MRVITALSRGRQEALSRGRLEDQKFKVVLDYLSGSRPVCARDLVFNRQCTSDVCGRLYCAQSCAERLTYDRFFKHLPGLVIRKVLWRGVWFA